MKATCSKCDSVWFGQNQHHCSVCHVTIGSIAKWDAHRAGKLVKGRRTCLNPADLGLKLNVHGIWVQEYIK